ncbi:MAG TPA: DUF6062 family protein [Candidatus Acidoferrales bacterium]|nr:DUF6062 family protein [Candidatus Acidoferrales bacterium]
MSELKIEDDLTRAKRGLTWLRLEEALHGTDCPICSQMEKTEKHYIEGILYEYVLDAGVRKKLHNGHGFCTHHAKCALEAEKKLRSDGLHLATMFESVVEENLKILRNQIELLNNLTSEKNKRKKKKSVHSINVTECLICNFVEEAEQIAVHGFLYFSSDEELIETYVSSRTILCFRHTEMLVKEKVNTRIVKTTVKKLDKIKEDLSNFMKKHDYQSAQDYSEDELRSYIDAVNFFPGEYRK